MDFKKLITSLSKINQELREQSISAVNTSLTLRNWFFGFYIIEFEQNGNDRAEYGRGLLATISKEMKGLHISNTDERELRRYRQFYMVYPEAAKLLSSDQRIRGLLPPESGNNHIEIIFNQIRGAANPELNIPDIHYISLFKKVSYTHFIELLSRMGCRNRWSIN